MTENETNAASGSSPAIDAVLKRRRASIIEVVDAKSAVDLATAQSYSENVFLFVPNLIGELTPTPSTRPPLMSSRSLSCRVSRFLRHASIIVGFRMSRVHSSDPRRTRNALHGSPSKVFDHRILHLPTFGCRRRARRQVSRPGVKVRRRP